MSASAALDNLLAAYRNAEVIQSCFWLAKLDQGTTMPRLGATHRAQQMALLAKLRHKCMADPSVAEWVAAVESSSLIREPNVADALRAIRLELERATRTPALLVEAIEQTSSEALAAWRAAREAHDFAIYRPKLEAMVRLKQEEADALRDGQSGVSRHDVFLSYNERGMTTQAYQAVQATLRIALQPVIDSLPTAESDVPPCLIGRSFSAARLATLLPSFAEHLGLDPTWGRAVPGLAAEYFRIGRNDIRVVMRCEENDLLNMLALTAHEVGHATYAHARDRVAFGDPVMEIASDSVDEAHARLLEAVICKTSDFWAYAYPLLRRHLGAALRKVSREMFVASTRYAVRGRRVRTDDLTYCAAIGVRSDIEIALLDGSLAARNVPEAFDEGMCALFGSAPGLLRTALNDPHWAGNWYGHYPTYVLGSVYAAQLWAAIGRAMPEVGTLIRQGQFGPINEWLWENVQRYGRSLPPGEVMKRATGSALDPNPWIALMHERYANVPARAA